MRPIRSAMACALVAWTVAVPHAADAELQGVVRAAGRAVKDVVVWLDVPHGQLPAPQTKALLDQRNMQFVPRLLAVRVGTEVEMPNSDRLFHNVFDLGVYPVGASKTVTFDRPGVSRIFCNIHPTMGAYVVAVDSPYFAVSDPAGRIAIAGVQDGSYTYHAWRSGKPNATGTLIVAAGHLVEISLK